MSYTKRFDCKCLRRIGRSGRRPLGLLLMMAAVAGAGLAVSAGASAASPFVGAGHLTQFASDDDWKSNFLEAGIRTAEGRYAVRGTQLERFGDDGEQLQLSAASRVAGVAFESSLALGSGAAFVARNILLVRASRPVGAGFVVALQVDARRYENDRSLSLEPVLEYYVGNWRLAGGVAFGKASEVSDSADYLGVDGAVSWYPRDGASITFSAASGRESLESGQRGFGRAKSAGLWGSFELRRGLTLQPVLDFYRFEQGPIRRGVGLNLVYAF